MTETRTEQELVGIAAALAGNSQLTPAERQMIDQALAPDPAAVAACRALIEFGLDPLGESFLAIRSAKDRRKLGAVYTPETIVAAMIGWAANEGEPARVVDPGAGSGRYLMLAAKSFPKAALLACEIDPLASLLLRANAHVQGFSHRLEIHLEDYRRMALPRIEGRTLFIGNPPYVRHHQVDPADKEWFADAARHLGFKASKLAGLHAHFFVRTRQLGRRGDYGAFVTAAEWMDVNYGSIMREMLADGLGGSSLQMFAAADAPFANTMTTGVITCFKVGERPDMFTVRELSSAAELDDLGAGRRVDWREVMAESRWSRLFKPVEARQTGMVELGTLFSVHRGTVTGNNRVFLKGDYPGSLPDRFLRRTVTKARDLFGATDGLRETTILREVIDLPADLSVLSNREKKQVAAFLDWARTRAAHQSYTARGRRAWWAIRLRPPAPILCTYMARRAPAFVRNHIGAAHINIAHGLYPRANMTPQELDAYTDYLARNVGVGEGRTYAGGLTKFEPKEIERILVPSLESVHAAAASQGLDHLRTAARCGDGEGQVSY